MSRFYQLSLKPTLFGDFGVLRHWGRIGTKGRQLLTFYPTQAAAEKEMVLQLERRRKRGYIEHVPHGEASS